MKVSMANTSDTNMSYEAEVLTRRRVNYYNTVRPHGGLAG